tara:strand:- start:271 stop:2064 length:1794 start_codon:yes stop_codon:yes gene_type:complete
MNKYRTHNCNELGKDDIGKNVKISGWLHRKRDHGNLLFVDIRDHFGITQCVIENRDKNFSVLEKTKPESVLLVSGKVLKRSTETENKDLKTGLIEIKIENIVILSNANDLPMPVFGEQEYPEEIRLRYRFIDLRRKDMHKNIELRSNVISYLREKMLKNNFLEFQTPILTASSPEGARDFLVPSRTHPGKFYALPQAPQQFKQMIMIAGFDRYFQIAPCFRDEDGRADRSPGEHYQLDIEMSFVEQDDIFNLVEPIFYDLFLKYGKDKKVNKFPFPRIKYKDAIEKYGTDKPDLRNPIELKDVSKLFSSKEVTLKIFKDKVMKGDIVKVIPVPDTISKPRSFFDNLNNWAISEGASGMAYITFEKSNKKIIGKGPIAKFFSDNAIKELLKICKLTERDSAFFICNNPSEANKFAGVARQKIGTDLGLIDEKMFKFCWITDYPMYQYNEKEKKIDFSHNPFSMPQVEIEDFDKKDPLEILAYQYDLVCNGYELSSGAIRNHIPDYLFKVFKKVGYSKEKVMKDFSGMINALSFGAPPHGGMAPGIDRIIMLLAEEKNIREVTLFPLNQNAQDLLMSAPSTVDENQLKELKIKIDKSKN